MKFFFCLSFEDKIVHVNGAFPLSNHVMENCLHHAHKVPGELHSPKYNALMGCAVVSIPDPLDFERCMRLACAYHASDLFDYFWIIHEDHPDSPFIMDFVDSAHTWLTGCKHQYSTLLLELHSSALAPTPSPPQPSMQSPMVQEVALPAPEAPKASYTSKVAALPTCPAAAPTGLPNKP